jgi:RimJ/RimL family protein N-acetyltransferase
VLRPALPADLDVVHPLWTTPEVRRFLFDDRIIDVDETRVFLEASESSFREHAYGLWLASGAGAPAPEGFAGLLHSPSRAPNLVFGVQPGSCGRGVATEIAGAVIRYAFEVLRLPEIAADVDEPNTASVRVLEKLGMSLAKRATVNGRELRFYSFRNE